ncbi:MAG: hypothetical protein GY830_00955 [Bacteroidetes bacterium]|nr:hypothetical protein [Bacteroidota bacterium]
MKYNKLFIIFTLSSVTFFGCNNENENNQNNEINSNISPPDKINYTNNTEIVQSGSKNTENNNNKLGTQRITGNQNNEYVNDLVASITHNYNTQLLLESHGLKATKITWEDTARTKGSCWGPNISDMTLITSKNKALMPVIRKPNFADVTHDIPIKKFQVPVGNENGSKIKVIPLSEYLMNLKKYCANQNIGNLYDKERDINILTSAQCCILPCKKRGKCEFNVQLFNYQSYDDNPAVLVILVTKDGTSAQILENSNQKLYFNDNGDAKTFIAERLQDVQERRTGKQQQKLKSFNQMSNKEKTENVIMMIQVPLKVKQRTRSSVYTYEECDFQNECAPKSCQNMSKCMEPLEDSKGMDMASIKTGSNVGSFIGTKGLTLQRDFRYPIRCTFQCYRVTDENLIKDSMVTDIADQLNSILAKYDSKGSLVLGGDDGRTTEPKKTVVNKNVSTSTPFNNFFN